MVYLSDLIVGAWLMRYECRGPHKKHSQEADRVLLKLVCICAVRTARLALRPTPGLRMLLGSDACLFPGGPSGDSVLQRSVLEQCGNLVTLLDAQR